MKFINKITEYFLFNQFLNIIWWSPVVITINRGLFEADNITTLIPSLLIAMAIFAGIKNSTVSQMGKKHQNHT